MTFGVALYTVVAVAGAPLIAAAYHEPRLEKLMVLGALAFVVLPLGMPYLTLLQKELQFAHIAWMESAAALAGLGVLAALAWAGYGVNALIAAAGATNLVKTIPPIILGARHWRPHFVCDLRASGFFLRFSSYQLGTRLLQYVVARFDRLIVSAYLGPAALGYYALAWNIVVDPVHRINPILTRVLTPVFAKVQDDRTRLRRGFLLMIEAVAMVNMPLVAGLAVLASLLIPLVFGPQWLPCIPIVQVLALVAAARAIANPTGALVLAKGRADLAFRVNALAAICLMAVLVLAGQSGSVLVVAVTLALFQVLLLGGIYLALYRPLLGPCLVEWLGRLAPSVVLSGVMAAVLMLVKRTLPQDGLTATASLVFVGALIYAVLYWVLRPDTLKLWLRMAFGASFDGRLGNR